MVFERPACRTSTAVPLRAPGALRQQSPAVNIPWGVLLLFSGTLGVALAFAVVAGFGIGAFSPLQGMRSETLFDRGDLGATMGFYGAVMLLALIFHSAVGSRWRPAVRNKSNFHGCAEHEPLSLRGRSGKRR